MRAAGLATAAAIVLGVALGVLASLPSVPMSLVAAPVLVLLMSGTLFAVKLMRMPDAPLTGHGVELFLLIYGGAGVLGAVIGRIVRTWVRVLG